MKNKPKYTLWYINHENVYTVSAQKAKDTNSIKEVENWINGIDKAASFYREEEEINADYVQFFNE